MRIEVIGPDGAPGPGRLPLTLLVDGTLMIDAGSAVSGLDPARAPAVKTVLLTHAHLDHVRELGFLPFHRDPERDGLLEIAGPRKVLEAVRTAVFNKAFWVDFERPRPPRRPGIRYRPLEPRAPATFGSLRVEGVPLAHSVYECWGYVIEGNGASIVTAFDSGPTDAIWERARSLPRVDAVLYDVSFPDRFADVLNEHNTPATLAREVAKLRPHRPRVVALHLKPEFRDETREELRALPLDVEIPSAGDVLEIEAHGRSGPATNPLDLEP